MRVRMIHNDSLSCEPLLSRMPDGSLLCVCQCGDTFEPAPGNREYVFKSYDNGDTWSKPVPLMPERGLAVYSTAMNVIDGAVTVYSVTHSGRFLNLKSVVMRSDDSGKKWTNIGHAPHYPENCFVRDMLRLRNGNILVPVQYFPIPPEENARLIIESFNIADPRKQKAVWDARIDHVETNILLSEDNGVTYTDIKGPVMMTTGSGYSGWSWSEPTLAELSDGRIVMLMRWDRSGRLWRSESSDGGRTWSKPEKTDIPNPSNKPRLIGLDDGRIALIHTPNENCGFTNRNPLEIWISDDDMKTWSDKRTVGAPPFAYCYPDGFYEDGHILFTIETNRHEILFFDVEV